MVLWHYYAVAREFRVDVKVLLCGCYRVVYMGSRLFWVVARALVHCFLGVLVGSRALLCSC